ncbi:hypothetical protein GAMM_30066 [Gammaproteobacteria bacterium]
MPYCNLINFPYLIGAPYGTRTHVFAVRGRRPRPLDEGSKQHFGLVMTEFRLL